MGVVRAAIPYYTGGQPRRGNRTSEGLCKNLVLGQVFELPFRSLKTRIPRLDDAGGSLAEGLF